MRLRALCLVLLITAAAIPACSSDGAAGPEQQTSVIDSSTAPSITSTTTTATTIEVDCSTSFAEPTARADEEDSIVEWLQVIADTHDSRRYTAIHNYALIRTQAGVDAYTGSDDPREVGDYISTVYAGSLFSTFFRKSVGDLTAWHAELGFAFLDVEQEVDIGLSPLPNTHLFRVMMPPEVIAEAVQNDPLWSPDLTVEQIGSATVYNWGDYQTDLQRTSVARPLGEAGQLAVIGDLVVRTQGHEDLEPILVAISGEHTTLYDDSAYQSVAGGLDARGASDVIISSEPILPSGLFTHYVVSNYSSDEFFDRNPLLAPYLLIGIGRVQTKEGVSGVVALFHSSAQLAAENADRFCREVATGFEEIGPELAWSHRLGMPAIDVDGQLMIAQFPAQPDDENWTSLFRAWANGDTLFWIDTYDRVDS